MYWTFAINSLNLGSWKKANDNELNYNTKAVYTSSSFLNFSFTIF